MEQGVQDLQLNVRMKIEEAGLSQWRALRSELGSGGRSGGGGGVGSSLDRMLNKYINSNSQGGGAARTIGGEGATTSAAGGGSSKNWEDIDVQKRGMIMSQAMAQYKAEMNRRERAYISAEKAAKAAEETLAREERKLRVEGWRARITHARVMESEAKAAEAAELREMRAYWRGRIQHARILEQEDKAAQQFGQQRARARAEMERAFARREEEIQNYGMGVNRARAQMNADFGRRSVEAQRFGMMGNRAQAEMNRDLGSRSRQAFRASNDPLREFQANWMLSTFSGRLRSGFRMEAPQGQGLMGGAVGQAAWGAGAAAHYGVELFNNLRRIIMPVAGIFYTAGSLARLGLAPLRMLAGPAEKLVSSVTKMSAAFVTAAGAIEASERRLSVFVGAKAPGDVQWAMNRAIGKPFEWTEYLTAMQKARTMGVTNSDFLMGRGQYENKGLIQTAEDMGAATGKPLDMAISAIIKMVYGRSASMQNTFGFPKEMAEPYGFRQRTSGEGLTSAMVDKNIIAIQNMVRDRIGGTAEAMSDTFEASIKDMIDIWQSMSREVKDSDFFLYIRGVLLNIRIGFKQLLADGTVKNWAKQWSEAWLSLKPLVEWGLPRIPTLIQGALDKFTALGDRVTKMINGAGGIDVWANKTMSTLLGWGQTFVRILQAGFAITSNMVWLLSPLAGKGAAGLREDTWKARDIVEAESGKAINWMKGQQAYLDSGGSIAASGKWPGVQVPSAYKYGAGKPETAALLGGFSDGSDPVSAGIARDRYAAEMLQQQLGAKQGPVYSSIMSGAYTAGDVSALQEQKLAEWEALSAELQEAEENGMQDVVKVKEAEIANIKKWLGVLKQIEGLILKLSNALPKGDFDAQMAEADIAGERALLGIAGKGGGGGLAKWPYSDAAGGRLEGMGGVLGVDRLAARKAGRVRGAGGIVSGDAAEAVSTLVSLEKQLAVARRDGDKEHVAALRDQISLQKEQIQLIKAQQGGGSGAGARDAGLPTLRRRGYGMGGPSGGWRVGLTYLPSMGGIAGPMGGGPSWSPFYSAGPTGIADTPYARGDMAAASAYLGRGTGASVTWDQFMGGTGMGGMYGFDATGTNGVDIDAYIARNRAPLSEKDARMRDLQGQMNRASREHVKINAAREYEEAKTDTFTSIVGMLGMILGGEAAAAIVGMVGPAGIVARYLKWGSDDFIAWAKSVAGPAVQSRRAASAARSASRAARASARPWEEAPLRERASAALGRAGARVKRFGRGAAIVGGSIGAGIGIEAGLEAKYERERNAEEPGVSSGRETSNGDYEITVRVPGSYNSAPTERNAEAQSAALSTQSTTMAPW